MGIWDFLKDWRLGSGIVFILSLILLVIEVIGQKASIIFALFGQKIFTILYIIFGIIKEREDNVYAFILR